MRARHETIGCETHGPMSRFHLSNNNLLCFHILIVNNTNHVIAWGVVKVDTILVASQLLSLENATRDINHLKLSLAVDDPFTSIEEGEGVSTFFCHLFIHASAGEGDVEA